MGLLIVHAQYLAHPDQQDLVLDSEGRERTVEFMNHICRPFKLIDNEHNYPSVYTNKQTYILRDHPVMECTLGVHGAFCAPFCRLLEMSDITAT